ncbi:hypothetical protein GOP47_0010636 [Adiantum capillus-veneris]|uniref:RING-type domain-containing protein n=1 Tax=Adiantum capillus-veneris TaxID=13818 RepID=A0A9D4UVN9_ADICA|nr:hypothetical protein GOP47_0010636 [Adiantum capillus-veneris]
MMIASASRQDMALEAKSSREKCGICCIPVSTRGVLDCCSDIFCYSCIDTWSAFTNSCPLCKLRFKFITFVPAADDGDASDVETQDAFFDFLGQERVDDWIDEHEEDGTLSFPSFFIDEDAVVCLDGDACLVRKGLNEKDAESGLEDISVACDSCDCWYHASCVGYNPDSQGERSWICPRCVGTGVLDLFKFQSASKNLSSKLSSKSLSLHKDGSFTFVDEGETAVVVSMDASFGSVLDEAADQGVPARSTSLGIKSSLDETCLETSVDPEGSVLDEAADQGVSAGSPSLGNEAADRGVSAGSPSLGIEGSLDEGCLETALDPEKIPVVPSMCIIEKLLSNTSNMVSNVSVTEPEASAFDEVTGQKDVAVEEPSSCADVMQQPSETCPVKPAVGIECSLTYPHLNTTHELVVKSSLSPPIQDEGNTSSMTVVCAQSSSQVPGDNQNAPDVGKLSESMGKEFKGELHRAQEDENLKQELVSGKQQNKVPKRREPPCSLPDKEQRGKKKLKLEDRRSLPSSRSKVQMMHLRESSFDSIPSEAAESRELVKRSINEEVRAKNESDYCTSSEPEALSVQEVLKPKSEVMDELKELVQGPAPCHRRVVIARKNTTSATNGSSEGVRTRKIVYRGSTLDENVCRIVNDMRQHLQREAAALGILGDDRKVDVADEKFFVAFKAAIQSSQANLRQQHPSPVKRMAVQKPGSKLDASRQNLMKKLYGGSGKRRQAWDRDWDVSFWRERITREKKSRESSKTLLQQEMAHMEEAMQESKKSIKAELNSLKSRVYLADTSLLPRQKDIKPLSEQSTAKTNPVYAPQSKSLNHVRTPEGPPKRATTLGVSNTGETDGNQPVKTDKRRWALEVLARKTGQSEKIQRNNGSLLAELPGHMRPVVEFDRRSKVPSATRQIQLDRFLEHYLQQAPTEIVCDNPECQAAVREAINKEKEIYDRSNSKGVYVNLCVQALTSLPKLATVKAEETSPVRAAEFSPFSAAETSVEAAGTSNNDDRAVLMAWKAAGLISDSPPETCGGPETEVPGMRIDCIPSDGNLDSESPNDRNSPPAGNSHSIGILPNSVDTNTETGSDKFCSNGVEDVRDEETCIQGTLRHDANNDTEKVPEDKELGAQKEMIEEKAQDQEANCDQHTLLEPAPGEEGNLKETEHCCSAVSMPVQEQPSDMIQGFPLDASTQAEQHTLETMEKISKQVELYVKEHIRPLHKSHIITTEQYKWAVTKTTNKVMQHHSQAKSADFLIVEGEKVRRLAEQYLEIYSKHIFPGVK